MTILISHSSYFWHPIGLKIELFLKLVKERKNWTFPETSERKKKAFESPSVLCPKTCMNSVGCLQNRWFYSTFLLLLFGLCTWCSRFWKITFISCCKQEVGCSRSRVLPQPGMLILSLTGDWWVCPQRHDAEEACTCIRKSCHQVYNKIFSFHFWCVSFYVYAV